MINNAKEELLKNTMRHVAGKLVKKSKYGVAKNITKNIPGEIFSSVSETLASSYATEVVNYVFDPML